MKEKDTTKKQQKQQDQVTKFRDKNLSYKISVAVSLLLVICLTVMIAISATIAGKSLSNTVSGEFEGIATENGLKVQAVIDTAANTATEAIDKIRDSSISHGRCSVVEVMGRKRGYIALWAGMATSADAIILPEKWDGNYNNVTDAIKRRHEDGRNSYLVVVAEGVTDANELADLIKKKTK